MGTPIVAERSAAGLAAIPFTFYGRRMKLKRSQQIHEGQVRLRAAPSFFPIQPAEDINKPQTPDKATYVIVEDGG